MANTSNDQNISLLNQMVSQNISEPVNAFAPFFNQILNGFSNNDNFITGLQQSIFSFFYNLLTGGLPGVIAYLSNLAKSFILNPDLAHIANSVNNNQDLSYLIRQFSNTIYGITIDLLLLLFIFSIWHYWTQASWRANTSSMSAIGRLIVVIAMIMAWPTIYSFEIELSNEMINAIFFNASEQLQLFDSVMSNVFQFGIPAQANSLIISTGVSSIAIDLVSHIALFLLCILGIILIYELVYLVALKAMQTALLAAHYIFAPLFLVFFATPSTESVATSYIRNFVEVSLWSFLWIGLLKLLVVLMYANFNPWGKILTAIGILQIMMRVPQFLAKAKISNVSTYINPHFIAQPLQNRAIEYGSKIIDRSSALKTAIASMFTANNSGSTRVDVLNPQDFSYTAANGRLIPLPVNIRKLTYGNTNDKSSTQIDSPNNNGPTINNNNTDSKASNVIPVDFQYPLSDRRISFNKQFERPILSPLELSPRKEHLFSHPVVSISPLEKMALFSRGLKSAVFSAQLPLDKKIVSQLLPNQTPKPSFLLEYTKNISQIKPINNIETKEAKSKVLPAIKTPAQSIKAEKIDQQISKTNFFEKGKESKAFLSNTEFNKQISANKPNKKNQNIPPKKIKHPGKYSYPVSPKPGLQTWFYPTKTPVLARSYRFLQPSLLIQRAKQLTPEPNSHNLILSHGNFPIFVGIPPIYSGTYKA